MAITDGARAIRNRMLAVFGVAVVILLDWYHLCKTRRLHVHDCCEQDRKIKAFEIPTATVMAGETTIVLEYLKTQVTARNQDKCEELIGYLERHQQEIIDYNRRSKAGMVTIGSGRMEKGVDLAVGRRQKKKAMSWRPRGSSSFLSLLKVAELNVAVAITLVSGSAWAINGKFTGRTFSYFLYIVN